MSGIEVGLAVISAVAALVAAYKDGDKIVARIKKRRARRGAVQPSEELEKALKDGETDMTRLKAEGANLHTNDEAALAALKDLVIEIQGTLLDQLAKAEQDDDFDDFYTVTNSAIRTRRKAVNLLNDLYTRADEERRTRARADQTQRQSQQEATTQSVDEEDVKERKSRKSWFRRSSIEASSKKTKKSKHTPTPTTEPNSPIDKRYSITPTSPTITRNTTLVASPTITRHSTAALSVGSRASTFSMLSPPLSPEQIHPITKQNDFGGFCQGAWHAQKMELKKSVGLSIRDMNRAYHCTKCKYSLPADTRDKNHPHFDDRVYKLDEMLFRLMFLLKSHRTRKNSRDQRVYGCMFCALAGGSERRFAGEGHFLEHIARHKSQIYGDVQLNGPISVSATEIWQEWVTYDVLFEAGEDFVLPPSAMGDAVVPESPLSLPEDLFGNVWADDGTGAG